MTIVCALLGIYTLVLFGRALLSWFPISPSSPMATVQSFTFTLTEPVLAPVRSLLPPMGGFDISFIVVIIAMSLLRSALCGGGGLF